MEQPIRTAALEKQHKNSQKPEHKRCTVYLKNNFTTIFNEKQVEIKNY